MFRDSFVMENYTPFHVVKFKQTYQTAKSTSPQKLGNTNGALHQVITNGIQLSCTVKRLAASSADVSRQNPMTMIHILFSK